MGAEEGMQGRLSPPGLAGKVGARGLLLFTVVLALNGAAIAAVPAYGFSGGNGSHTASVGKPPQPPAGTADEGPAPASHQIDVTIALNSADPAGLESYATAVSTPGNPEYHQFLKPSAFAGRFGASPQDAVAVRDWLVSTGLNPGPTSPNNLAIPISASIGSFEKAFQVSLHSYHEPSGRSVYGNVQAPEMPGYVAEHVQAVLGLDDFYLRQAGPGPQRNAGSGGPSSGLSPHATSGPTWSTTCVSTIATPTWTADQLASAYSMSTLYGEGLFGSGVTVGLFELEPYASSDITGYESCYTFNGGHPNPTITNVPVDGGAGTGSGSGEAALDIEDVLGLAPEAKIDVYEGPNTNSGVYDTYNTMISQDTVQVISTSWGLCEPYEGSSAAQAENTLYQEAATQGQSIFSAAGDDGSSDCSTRGGLAVDDPASQPYVTGVGGTDLTSLTPAETVWNGGCSSACAGGGGISTFWQMPSWQQGNGVINGNSSGSPCGATTGSYCREVPDVTASADPSNGYRVYYKGSWIAIGGTSGAAPLWASLVALINSGCAPLGFLNPRLYQYPADLHDITSGNNHISRFVAAGDYTASTAYDLASGLGSPNAVSLFSNLCAPIVVAVNPNTGPTTGGTDVTITGRGFVPGSTNVAFGTSSATRVTVSLPTLLTAVSPPGPVGSVHITVTTPDGVSTHGTADEFEYTTAPATTTEAATNLTMTSATLNGSVNPGGSDTTYYFEYGATTSYGLQTSTNDSGSGMSAVQVSSNIAGLSPDASYHFQLVATNADGTSYGGDGSFTESPCISYPCATSPDASWGGAVPQDAIDGNSSTWWQPVAATTTPTLEIDLGSPTTVSAVSTDWYSTQYAPSSYEIQTSTDGVNWTTQLTVTGNTDVSRTDVFPDGSVTATYLQLVVTNFTPPGSNPAAYVALREFGWS